MTDRRDRIESAGDLHHGEPYVRGTRVSVSILVASLAELPVDELLREYPQLNRADVTAALLYAAEAAHNTLVAP